MEGPLEGLDQKRIHTVFLQVHSFMKKHYAFFDSKGLRVDEDIEEEPEESNSKSDPVASSPGKGKKRKNRE